MLEPNVEESGDPTRGVRYLYLNLICDGLLSLKGEWTRLLLWQVSFCDRSLVVAEVGRILAMTELVGSCSGSSRHGSCCGICGPSFCRALVLAAVYRAIAAAVGALLFPSQQH